METKARGAHCFIITNFILLIIVWCANYGVDAQTDFLFMPAIFVNKISALKAQIYLEQIPLEALKANLVEVTIWNNAGLTEEGTTKWEQVLTVTDLDVVECPQLGFCVASRYVSFKTSEEACQRAVLRIGAHSQSFRQIPAVPTSPFPCMVSDYHIYPPPGPETEGEHVYSWQLWESPHIGKYGRDSMQVRLAEHLEQSFLRAEQKVSKLVTSARAGYSGTHFQHFINNIGSVAGARYLEVGVFNGSSLDAVLHDNDVPTVAIDSWDDRYTASGGASMKQMGRDVIAHITSHYGRGSTVSSSTDNVRESVENPGTSTTVSRTARLGQVHILQENCWKVSPSHVRELLGGPASVYFYDAGHYFSDHYLSLMHYISALDNAFILMVDDWNWSVVRRGTRAAISNLPLEEIAFLEVTTDRSLSCENHPWHNGLGAFVFKKL